MARGGKARGGDRGRLLVALMGSVALVSLTAPAQAQSGGSVAASRGQARAFDIPSQPLSTALTVFGDQTGIQITGDTSILDGKRSQAVRGSYAPAEALSLLLSGTGITFRWLDSRSVSIERAPQVSDGAISLGPVRVQGASTGASSSHIASTFDNRAVTTEGTKSYTAPVVSVGKGEQIRDIPQSVSVVTRQQIEDQGFTEVTQAIAQAAGVATSVESRGGELEFYTRGFAVNSLQIDGSSTGGDYAGHYINPNLAMYDHIEVLRGVDGLFSGMGNPGGTINLVRKRPLRDLQLVGTLSAGSWNNYRAEIDFSAPVIANGDIRARVVGSYIDRDFFYGSAMDRKKFVYGIVEADASPTTTLTLGANYEDRHRKANYTGIPIYEDGTIARLPRSTSLSPNWNSGDFDTWEVFGGIEQRIGRDWVLKASISRIDRSGFEGLGGWAGDLLPTGGSDQSLFAWGYGYESVRTFYDVNLAGTFDLFGRTHKLLIGTDFQKQNWGQFYDVAVFDQPIPAIDVFDFDPGAFPAPVGYRKGTVYLPIVDKQRGIYGRLTLEAVKSVKMVLGGRVSWLSYDSKGTSYNADGTVAWDYHDKFKEGGVFTPYAGVVVDVLPEWTTYLSLSRIYKSQASSLSGPLPGTSLAPLKGSNYELGVKGELAAGRLNLSLALYRAERTGEAVQDPAYPPTYGDFGVSCCYLNSGKIVSKGIDTEIAGEIAPGWQVSASYTFNKNENHGTTDLPYNSIVPRHLGKLWTSYQFGGSLSRLRVGGGVTAQSRIYLNETSWLGNIRRIEQGGYSVWNAMAEYRTTDAVTVTLNLNNVFDETYFASLGNRNRGAWYGEPRSFLISLRGRF